MFYINFCYLYTSNKFVQARDIENINDCIEVDCGNGTCQEQLAGYVCVCQTGYTGEHCETNIDDCASDPCLSGQCRDLVSGFYCDCGQPLKDLD